MKTITHLYNRRQTLIALNKKNCYSFIYAPEEKQAQYYRCLLALRVAEKKLRDNFRNDQNKKHAERLQLHQYKQV